MDISFFFPFRWLGLGCVTNILPLKPFETVTVFKGLTNEIGLELAHQGREFNLTISQ